MSLDQLAPMVALNAVVQDSSLCNHAVRGGGYCKLDPGHRGDHSVATYFCECCQKMRRGRPHAYGQDGEHERGLAVCFLCARGIT